jgi:ribonuclease P/MRP protein subunit RPP1
MPFYDLNVPHDSNVRDLSRTIAFHAELGFTQIAIALSITGKIPATPPPVPLESITVPKSVSLLTRLTLHIHDPSQNHRLAQLQSAYDLIALRPTTEKALGLCCNSLECDLISLDFSVRLGYPLRFKTVASALQRGIRFEICYSPGITGGSDARRNLIGGTAALIRATRGRGIIISSEARSALGLRGPWDVINLAVVWGINQERGKEAICEEARKVLRLARLKRDIVFGGEKVGDVQKNQDETRLTNGTKRKAIDISGGVSHTEEAGNNRPLSKGQMKRLKKQQRNTRLEGAEVALSEKDQTQAPAAMPILHETLVAHEKT